MSSTDLAVDYARKLVSREVAGSGDLEAAMRRLEAKTGIGYWTWWGLWNKRRKGVGVDLFSRIRGAYLATCERQIRALQHDLALEKAKGGDDTLADLVAEAESLAAKVAALVAKRGGS